MNSVFYFASYLIFSATFSCFSFGANLGVEFFDVGQGHCTLVYFKEGPPLLVDAGSSEIPGDAKAEKESFKTKQLASIASAIKSKGKTTNKTKWKVDLNVIISHGDGDHYNWVTQLFDSLSSTLRVRFLLGGKKGDYNDDLQALVKRHEKKDTPSYVNEYAGDLSKIPLFVCYQATCIILAAESTADKNRNSIVVKVTENDGEKKSVILAGDATGQTTRKILENYAANLGVLKTTILQASHHGADSDDSNSADWFEAISPSYVVISAGTRRDYMHPKQKTLENALRSPNLKRDVPLHLLRYNTERPFFGYHRMLLEPKTVFRLSDDYLAALTRAGIFNTSNQGTISFIGKDIKFEKTPKKDKVSIISEKDLIFFLFQDVVFVEKIVALNFPDMTLSKPELRTMRRSLEKSALFLSCNFSEVTLESGDFEKEFNTFFQKLHSLEEVIFFKGIVEAAREKVKAMWNHRGLCFP